MRVGARAQRWEQPRSFGDVFSLDTSCELPGRYLKNIPDLSLAFAGVIILHARTGRGFQAFGPQSPVLAVTMHWLVGP